MFIGAGTLINCIAILAGSLLGIGLGSRLREGTRNLVTDVLGFVTMLGAASALIPLWSDGYSKELPQGWSLLVILASLLIGGIIGSLANLEGRLDHLGEYLRKKFGASSESSFIEGFVSASLLFVIGPLAILGSISDGMGQGIDQLILKSSLDFFASMAFAATLGWGVTASIIPIIVYQGAWTLIGVFLGNVLDQYQVDAMTISGGVLLIGIGLRLLKIRQIEVGNLIPALFLAPLIAAIAHNFV